MVTCWLAETVLAWLAGRGSVRLRYEGDRVVIEAARSEPVPGMDRLAEKVKESLAESSAYRAYFHRAAPEALIS